MAEFSLGGYNKRESMRGGEALKERNEEKERASGNLRMNLTVTQLPK